MGKVYERWNPGRILSHWQADPQTERFMGKPSRLPDWQETSGDVSVEGCQIDTQRTGNLQNDTPCAGLQRLNLFLKVANPHTRAWQSSTGALARGLERKNTGR